MTSVSRLAQRSGARPHATHWIRAMIRPGSPLAPKRFAGLCVSAALLVVLAQGCLMPQSVDPANTRPHTIPRVDLTNLPDYLLQPFLTLDPQEQFDVSPPCHCRLEILIPPIIADDPTVDVEVRVFVDYDVNVTSSQVNDRFTLRGTFGSSETTRPFGPLQLDSDKLRGPGLHVVELVIGEAAGFAPTTVFPPQRAMLPNFDSSTFKFVVKVLDPNTKARSCGDPPQPAAQKKSCP
jgi:hypothetical protein